MWIPWNRSRIYERCSPEHIFQKKKNRNLTSAKRMKTRKRNGTTIHIKIEKDIYSNEI